jgi:hypothetical protein
MTTYFAATLASGNIAVRSSEGDKYALILKNQTTPREWKTSADFPEGLLQWEEQPLATDPTAAAALYLQAQTLEQLAVVKESRKGWEKAFHALNDDPKKLRARLKQIETFVAKKEAKEKAKLAAAKQTEKEGKALRKKLAKIAAKLPQQPAAPLKGKGAVRVDMPTDTRAQKVLLTAIPAAHKAQVSTRQGKGRYSWQQVISPEAQAAFAKYLSLAETV